MELIVFGLNHRTAPLEVRERWAVPEQSHRTVLRGLQGQMDDSEHLILSTCNRTEFYSHLPRSMSEGSNGAPTGACLTRGALDFYRTVRHGLTGADNAGHHGDGVNPDYFYVHRQEAAVEHLFRLAGGLDSMIVGESQILKQIKDAYAAAQQAETAGRFFRRLFPAALRVGKRVRTTTTISDGCITHGQAGLELARRVHDGLQDRTVLVIGSGKIAGLTMTAVEAAGLAGCFVVNRTLERAHELVKRIGHGTSCEWSQLESLLERVDFVISSTGSAEPIISTAMMERVQSRRQSRPIAIVDLAIPRDVEPEVDDLPGVNLFNIDDLNQVVQENVDRRHRQVPKAEEIIREELSTFQGQLIYQQVDPVLKHLNQRFEQIRLGVLQKYMGQFPVEQHELVDQMTNTLLKKLLHFPISKLKSLRNLKSLSSTEVQFLRRLFLTDTLDQLPEGKAGRPEADESSGPPRAE